MLRFVDTKSRYGTRICHPQLEMNELSLRESEAELAARRREVRRAWTVERAALTLGYFEYVVAFLL